jgi:hypothetical protein
MKFWGVALLRCKNGVFRIIGIALLKSKMVGNKKIPNIAERNSRALLKSKMLFIIEKPSH